MNVVRFPVEQTRLPGESREAYSQRKAQEWYDRAELKGVSSEIPWTAWEWPLLDDLANGRTSE